MQQKIKIKIEGMHCPSCKTLIESEVKSLAGVKNVVVEFPTGQGEVVFDQDMITAQTILQSVKKLQYKIVEA